MKTNKNFSFACLWCQGFGDALFLKSLIFYSYYFSSVNVAEWSHFGKKLLTRFSICSLCICICKLSNIPFWSLGGRLGLIVPVPVNFTIYIYIYIYICKVQTFVRRYTRYVMVGITRVSSLPQFRQPIFHNTMYMYLQGLQRRMV